MIKNIQYAEQRVIGALLIKSELYDDICSIISSQDFSSNFYSELYILIETLILAGEKADVITVAAAHEEKTGRDHFSEIGGIAKGSITGSNISHHAELIKKNSTELKLLKIAQEIIALANDDISTSDKISRSQDLVMSISATSAQGGLRSTREICLDHAEELQKRSETNGLIGQSTSFDELDDMTGGFNPGDLIIIAGRPSMGKTTIAMNITEYMAVIDGKANDQILIYSLEMSSIQLIDRSISSIGRINFNRIRTGKLTNEEWNRVFPTAGRIGQSNMFIDETAALSISEIRARTRRAGRKNKIKLIMIDYIQLMDFGSDSDLQAITKITAGLKAMAKEADCPVIALSQLSRAVEQRPDKRPMLSDLRSSGSIEQDADIVMFMYRDEYYNKSSPDKGLAELIISKQRNGVTGTVILKSRLDQMRFESHPEGLSDREENKPYKDYAGFD